MKPEEAVHSGHRLKMTRKGFLKFLIPSLFGVIIFLFPIKEGNSFNIPLGVITEYLIDVLEGYLPAIITYVMIISTLFSMTSTLLKPNFIERSEQMKSLFHVSNFWLIIRVIGTVFAVMTYYQIGMGQIIGEETGGEILGLLTDLIMWFLVASFLMPFLINFGIMEFTGTLLRGLIRPLFTLPGRSAIDLLASWVGNVNVGVVLTRQQYLSGFYTGREAVSIATNFSTVSLPFSLVVARLLDMDHMFPVLYVTIIMAGVACAMIIPRIPPISRIPDTYYKSSTYTEVVPKDVSKLGWALEQAVKRANKAGSLRKQLKEGSDIFIGISFTLIPQVMAIGTIALIIAEFTPFFSIISQPMVYVLQLFQIPEAASAAPATLTGFIDMFMPAILSTEIESELTRFFIAALSLVQIIYLTEMGTLILVSKMPINLWKLFVVFLERTIISIPIIALVAHFLF